LRSNFGGKMNRVFRLKPIGWTALSAFLLVACAQGTGAASEEDLATPYRLQLPPQFTQTLTPSATLAASTEVPATSTPPSEQQIAPAPPIAAGWNHTCVITDQGGVMCWGSNDNGQLGDGSRTDRNQPAAVKGLAARIAAVAAGYGHTCALTADGGVQCWGRNKNGELGDGTNQRSSQPVNVSGLDRGVVAIAAGDDHTCAVTSQGAVKCWGYNGAGQLGDGTTENRDIPVDVQQLTGGVMGVAAGEVHSCVWTVRDEVMCWGANGTGQLGDAPDVPSRTVPHNVSGLSDGIAAINAKGSHTCILSKTGGIQCWGQNRYGQLGDGTAQNKFSPVSVNGLEGPASVVGAGWNQTCGVMTGGVLKCWGWNFYGQLGDGSVVSRPQPVAVNGITGKVTAVSGGGGHTCAIAEDGGVYCWGFNKSGQLGDRTNLDSRTPVKVEGISVKAAA
jgi:alpha-tubulin suppressor-like RCC1 family protein